MHYFKNKNIRIVNIWEDDYIYKKDIIESKIRNLLGLTENKIHARKCTIKEIDSLKIGLFYKEKLVSVMSFNGHNLLELCGALNTNIVGGASKMLKYYIKKYNPIKIISYVDKSFYTGDLFYKLGFSLIGEILPEYNDISKENKIYDCGKLKFELIL